jgi:predicted transcriptional regulator
VSRERYTVSPEIVVECEVIRAQLRKRRLDLGLTQVQVAQRIGRSQDFIAVCENHTCIPNLATLVLWVSALEGTVKVDWTHEETASNDDQEADPDLPAVDVGRARQELRRW